MYRVRFLILLARCFIEPMLPVNAKRSLRYRAIPLIDTDFTRMFTHSYATFMGLARWHLLFGSEFRGLAVRNRWAPVTTSEITSYRKSVRGWQAFNLETRIVFWDEACFYVEHLFVTDNVIHVRALVEGIVRGPSGILRPNDVFAAAGFTRGAPHISEGQMNEIECLKRLSGSGSKP
jgi:hypothetical protein